MTINQLFKKKPSIDLILKLLDYFNIKSLDSDITFSQKTIINNNIIVKSKLILDEIKIYYLPCKQKIYFLDITPKKLLTIIKQCLKLYNYKLLSQEKYINGDKLIIYRIIENHKKDIENKNNIIYKKYTLSFD